MYNIQESYYPQKLLSLKRHDPLSPLVIVSLFSVSMGLFYFLYKVIYIIFILDSTYKSYNISLSLTYFAYHS